MRCTSLPGRPPWPARQVTLLKRTPSATDAGTLTALLDTDWAGSGGFGTTAANYSITIDNVGSYYIAASFYASAPTLYLTGVRLTYTVGQAE